MKRLFLFTVLFYNCTSESNKFHLNRSTYKMWKDFIKPTKQELAWAEIPWRSTFYQGLIDADREEKPLLLWAMNGHPLGCT